MNKLFLGIISTLLVVLFSCSKDDSTKEEESSHKNVTEWFDFLCSPTLEGRFSGSQGIRESCDYIINVIDAGKDSLNVVEFEWRNVPLRNIIFHVDGTTDSTLVLGAHYDVYGYKTHSALPGADDNTSGVAVMLCIVKWLKESKVIPKYNIDVCFWDGEEIGRLGSSYYVAQLDEYQRKRMFYLNVDTVGSDKHYQVTLSYAGSLLPLSSRFCYLASSLSIPIEEYSPVRYTTDCEPFLRNNIPFYNICCNRLPPYLHKSTDVVSNISFEQIVKIANAIIENVIKTQ